MIMNTMYILMVWPFIYTMPYTFIYEMVANDECGVRFVGRIVIW